MRSVHKSQNHKKGTNHWLNSSLVLNLCNMGGEWEGPRDQPLFKTIITFKWMFKNIKQLIGPITPVVSNR